MRYMVYRRSIVSIRNAGMFPVINVILKTYYKNDG